MSDLFFLVSVLAFGFVYYSCLGELLVQLAVSGSGLDKH